MIRTVKKKLRTYAIEDGCGNYVVRSKYGKYIYKVAETRGRSKLELEMLKQLVIQANAVATAEGRQ